MASSRKSRSSTPARREVVSPDGQLCFVLKRTATGVHVDRRHQAAAYRVAHAAVFPDRRELERFLDLDELRFQYPLVYVEVRRAFDDLLETDV
jgi:hypothetical protein